MSLFQHLPDAAAEIASTQGWDEESLIIHLYGCLSENLPDHAEKLTSYFAAVAAEENGQAPACTNDPSSNRKASFVLLSDRFLSPMAEDAHTRATLARMETWVDRFRAEQGLYFSSEFFFFARHEDGRIGALFEFEVEAAEDASENPAVETAIMSPGEYSFDGGAESFGGTRLIYRAFFPGEQFDLSALEQTAKNIIALFEDLR